VPVGEDCIILVCTYIFLSLAGFEVLSLAIAWKNIPVCAKALTVQKNSKKKILMHALLVYRVIYGALQLE